MGEQLAEIWRFRDLLQQLVAREIKVRYKKSVFGFLWSIIPVCLQVVVFTFFVKAASGETTNNSAYLLCGLITWTFFSTTLLDSGQTLLVNYPILKKVYLPREVFPLTCALSNFIHFLMGWAVYFSLFFVILRFIPNMGVPILPTLVFFPLITLVLLLLVIGLSLWMSILSLFYDDIRFIVQTFMNLLMFVLPVIIPADVFRNKMPFKGHDWLFQIYMMNPITAIIEAYRKTILQPLPAKTFGLVDKPLPMNWFTFGGATVITLLILISGLAYFNHRKWEIVERW